MHGARPQRLSPGSPGALPAGLGAGLNTPAAAGHAHDAGVRFGCDAPPQARSIAGLGEPGQPAKQARQGSASKQAACGSFCAQTRLPCSPDAPRARYIDRLVQAVDRAYAAQVLPDLRLGQRSQAGQRSGRRPPAAPAAARPEQPSSGPPPERRPGGPAGAQARAQAVRGTDAGEPHSESLALPWSAAWRPCWLLVRSGGLLETSRWCQPGQTGCRRLPCSKVALQGCPVASHIRWAEAVPVRESKNRAAVATQLTEPASACAGARRGDRGLPCWQRRGP